MARRVFTVLAITGVTLYALVVVGFYVVQRDILFPAPSGYAAPASVGLANVQEEPFTAADGATVMVWRKAAMPGMPTILYFHGNGDSLPNLTERFQVFAEKGWGVVAATYRGYPGSTGKPSEEGLVSDGVAIFDRLVDGGVPANDIILAGYSLGSGVAVAVAAEREPCAVLLHAAFSSIAEVAAARYPLLPVRTFIKDPFDSLARIERVSAPVFLVHGSDDGLVPLRFAQRLMDGVRGAADLAVIDGAGHLLAPDAGVDAFQRFFKAEGVSACATRYATR